MPSRTIPAVSAQPGLMLIDAERLAKRCLALHFDADDYEGAGDSDLPDLIAAEDSTYALLKVPLDLIRNFRIDDAPIEIDLDTVDRFAHMLNSESPPAVLNRARCPIDGYHRLNAAAEACWQHYPCWVPCRSLRDFYRLGAVNWAD